jgi:chitin disaccharide deacetylase
MRVVICADDYGIAPGVGTAIRHLVEAGRLTAVSCMAASRHWPTEAALMRPLARHIDVGLHLTLTDQQPLGPMPKLAPAGRLPSIDRLVRASLFRHLPLDEIEAETLRQIEAFTAAFGAPPRFIDGHQHAHQVRGVGDMLLGVLRRQLPANTWLRYCDEPLSTISVRGVVPVRAGIVSLLGRRFAARGRRAGIPGNTGFRGVRSFTERAPFAEMFSRFLAPARDGMLIMCHPGLVDTALSSADPVTDQREEEYRYLLSDAFTASLRTAEVELAKSPPH